MSPFGNSTKRRNELSTALDDVLGANRQALWQFSFGMHVS